MKQLKYLLHSIDESIRQGYLARREGRPDDATRLFEQAIAEGRVGNLPDEVSQALNGLGQIERDQGKADRGITRYTEALAIERTLGHPQDIAHTLRHLGDMHFEQSRPDAAEPYYEEAMAIYRADPDTGRLSLANALLGYSSLRRLRGDIEAAHALLKEARTIYAELHIAAGVADCDEHLK